MNHLNYSQRGAEVYHKAFVSSAITAPGLSPEPPQQHLQRGFKKLLTPLILRVDGLLDYTKVGRACLWVDGLLAEQAVMV
ncbi:hypothetical protein DPEC_G00325380 [Dallia pectoralis]|uniref:Uncharacterized protein n=1 Tax=Dallia pectoralis TaxID=75939 RepID=A0ACC2F7R8_DALPE|nr:hypothetical protein DPEC_G00325380 [Dallia pectoralis]